MPKQELTNFTISSKPNMELNCNDKLIRDEVKVLNKKNSSLSAYCFSEEQAKEIMRRCKYRCKVETDGEIYVITKVEVLRKYENF